MSPARVAGEIDYDDRSREDIQEIISASLHGKLSFCACNDSQDDHALPETPKQKFSKNKKNKSRKKKKNNQRGSTNSDTPQNTENMEEARNTLCGALSQMNKSTTEKINEEERPWPDLIPDLVSEILDKLSYIDRISVIYATPSWRQAVEKPFGPCLLSFANDNKTYTISGMLHDFKETFASPDLSADIQILLSKHGWLLLMEAVAEKTFAIFFYNPISQVIMKLPPFNYPPWGHFSFSAPPDSPNCVVVFSYFADDWKKLAICEKGCDEWTLLQEDEDNYENFEAQYMSPVFHKGRFYWLGTDGRVGEFDLLTRSWAVHGTNMRLWPSTFRFYLVESDDELFSVWSTREGDTVPIYKLDLNNSHAIWKETYNLGGRCFFVGFRASISLTTRALSCKEEKIYFQMVDQANKFVYYSGETRKMHPHGNFMGCSELLFNYCWIEPQRVEPKFQELHWF